MINSTWQYILVKIQVNNHCRSKTKLQRTIAKPRFTSSKLALCVPDDDQQKLRRTIAKQRFTSSKLALCVSDGDHTHHQTHILADTTKIERACFSCIFRLSYASVSTEFSYYSDNSFSLKMISDLIGTYMPE